MTVVFTNKIHKHKILGLTQIELEVIVGDKIIKMGECGLLLHIATLSLQSGLKPIPTDMQTLLDEFAVVFEEPPGLPPNRSHDHHILLFEGSAPVNVRPYRYPYYQKSKIEKMVQEMLKTCIIRPSRSPFSSLVLMVHKADGGWRMCVDYRALNNITV